jgi:uncharacterized protein
MALLVPLALLARQRLQLSGELPIEDLSPGREDDLVRVDRPVRYDLWLEKLSGSVLVQGRLEVDLACQCARCLRPFRQTLVLDPWSVVLELEGAEAVPLVNDAVDLTVQVREDSLLALPQHPLCEPGCAGLPSTSSSGENEPEAARQSAGGLSAWAALDRLKL